MCACLWVKLYRVGNADEGAGGERLEQQPSEGEECPEEAGINQGQGQVVVTGDVWAMNILSRTLPFP